MFATSQFVHQEINQNIENQNARRIISVSENP